MKKKWTVQNTKKTNIGRFEITEELIELSNGHTFDYSYASFAEGVCVLPIINEKLGLIKQYRHIMKSYEWEVPAGMIDDGEEAIETAERELFEETGYHSDEIKSLGVIYPSVGSTSEKIHLFYAICNHQSQSELEQTEDIEVFELSVESVKEMIRQSQIKHAAGIIAIYKYLDDIKLEK